MERKPEDARKRHNTKQVVAKIRQGRCAGGTGLELPGLARIVRLKRLVADLSLDQQILRDVAEGNLQRLTGAGRQLRRSDGNISCRNAMPLPDRQPPRGTQRYIPTVRADEDALTQAIVTLASEYAQYGYLRIMA